MTKDPFIEIFAKQPMSRLDEMERDLTEQLERTKHELLIVAAAKAFKSSAKLGGDASRRSRHNGNGNGNGRSNKREPIKAVIETEPARAWLPSQVSQKLAEQDITASRDACRVTMNRMVEDGLLVRLDNGKGYILATHATADHQASSGNGLAPEPEGERETVFG